MAAAIHYISGSCKCRFPVPVQSSTYQKMATVFLTPCTVLLTGATSVGKTSLLRRILRYRDVLFDVQFSTINYFYGENTFEEVFKCNYMAGPVQRNGEGIC